MKVNHILVLIVLSLIVIYSNQPKVTGDFNDTIEDVKEAARLMGLTQVNNFYHDSFFILSSQYPDFYFWKTAGRVCCSKCCWLRHWRQILRAQGFQLGNHRQLYLPDIYVPKQHDTTGSLLSS